MNAELTHHLGYEKHDTSGHSSGDEDAATVDLVALQGDAYL